MAKITVTLDVDESTILKESGQDNLSDAISQELNRLNDSGMYVDEWHFNEQEKELTSPEEDLAIGEVDELVVRLSYYAGTLEAKKEISPPERSELCDVIGECIATYYVDKYSPAPSSIEELADKMLREKFPPEPVLREEKGISEHVVAPPDEIMVILAHMAGELEAKGQVAPMEWDDLVVAIHNLTNAYLNDPSESINPFCLEDAAERYFTAQFGTKEFRENAISEGWANKSPSELISEAKTVTREAPKAPEEELSAPADTTPQKSDFEYDRVIFRDRETGELFTSDCINKDDFLSEYSNLASVVQKFEIVGVHTAPECLAGYHPCTKSALWDDIPETFQDLPNDEALANLVAGKKYDVCYYYNKGDGNTDLYGGVDLNLNVQKIRENILANKYIEGAVIHESSRILDIGEYLHGMRRNTAECREVMTPDQLFEVGQGIDHGIGERFLLRPELSPAQLLKLRTEMETEIAAQEDPNRYYVATDYGPEDLDHGFKSNSNFAKYPDRVCYVPENWDFDDGPGITGQDIIDLCNGDKQKAQRVFDLCDWQFPSTVLDEMVREDTEEPEHLNAKGEQPRQRTFRDILRDAQTRAENPDKGQNPPQPHR